VSSAADGRACRVFVRVPHAWCYASRAAIDEVAGAAEELGFDGISVQDHLLSDSAVTPCGSRHGHDDRTMLEAISVLNYVAARTRRLRLLSSVLVVPYRNPILLAKETATLDVLSDGRLVLGVGIGALTGGAGDGGQSLSAHARIAQREFQAMGVRGDRGPLVDEMLGAVIALWGQDAATFRGRHIAFEGLDLRPRPVQRPYPPIWIGGRSEAALGRVARLGDGWFPSQASPELIAAGRLRIGQLASEAGRPVPVDQGVNLFASIADRDDPARAVVVDALGRRFGDLDALWDATLAGRPSTILARMRAYITAGVHVFDLKLLPLDPTATVAQLRLLADEVLPALPRRPAGGTAA
jgi:alkanesulfonate monooxygenase SsuD/methylene tetrahydromethanopterin reductase-like flavin-dependent oxidoreductase (luciferase family)